MTEQVSWGLAEGEAITPELTFLRKLGGGSAYEAVLAFDEVTYSPVVVKLVRPDQVASRSTLRGLRREAELLEQTRHPAVVRMLRAVDEGDRPHIVLEQLDGPRLSSLIRRHGPLEAHQFLPLGIEVAAALHYLHGLGVVHLDVKPSNIIMGAPAKLIDLSVARRVEQAENLGYVVGTDGYLAPSKHGAGPSPRVTSGRSVRSCSKRSAESVPSRTRLRTTPATMSRLPSCSPRSSTTHARYPSKYRRIWRKSSSLVLPANPAPAQHRPRSVTPSARCSPVSPAGSCGSR